MPSKPLELYQRRPVPKDPGMKKKQIRRAQTQEAKSVYERLREREKKMSLTDKLESLDISSNVIEHDDHLLATIELNYTLGDPSSIGKYLIFNDLPADEEKNEFYSKLNPMKTFYGTLDDKSEYKIKISSDIVKNTEEINFSITNMKNKSNQDYATLIKVIGEYISSMHDLRYGNERNKRLLKLD